MALIFPAAVVSGLLLEVERMVNGPVPLRDRPKRIAELEAELETLQRRALALGAELTKDFPPLVVLGVRVVQAKGPSRAA